MPRSIRRSRAASLVYGSRGILEMLRVRASDIVMPDLQHMGGPTEFLRAAAFADAYDTPASNHCYTEMSMQLLAAIPNFIVLEYMPWLEPIYASASRSTLRASDRAGATGLGLFLRPGCDQEIRR